MILLWLVGGRATDYPACGVAGFWRYHILGYGRVFSLLAFVVGWLVIGGGGDYVFGAHPGVALCPRL